jgi:polysaccharide export outer membrane protein
MIASVPLILSVLAAPSGPELKIDHAPLACVLKDRFPLVEAVIEPSANVAKAQVYFKAPIAETFHYVPMTLTLNRFQAKLPRPKDKAGSVVYYIQATDAAGAVQRTPEISAQIVKRRDACPEGGAIAAEGPEGDIRIYSTTPSPRKPSEYAGVAAVTTTQQAAAETAAAAALTSPASPGDPAPPAPAPPGATSAPSGTPSGTPPPPSTAPVDDEFEYLIGPNDILKVAVFGYDDLTQVLLIQPDGTFMYPLIGRVKASDMTIKELERKLIVLLGKGYIRNPQVTVTVQEARSRSLYVLGDVARAGRYSLVEAKTVLDLAARAGISNHADIMIVRPKGNVQGPVVVPAEPGQTGPTADPKLADTIRVSMRDIQAGDLSQNLSLRPNDTIFVVPGRRVYVMGEVRNPGAFAPPVGGTVQQMILQAGGFTDRASKGSVRISREVEGKKKEFKAKSEDLVLPGDIITVKAKLF